MKEVLKILKFYKLSIPKKLVDGREKGEKIIILPCEHYFKKEEIMKWLEDHSAACPICRKKLPNYEKIEKVPSNRSILINVAIRILIPIGFFLIIL